MKIREITRKIGELNAPKVVKKALYATIVRCICREYSTGNFSFGMFAQLRRRTLEDLEEVGIKIQFPSSIDLEAAEEKTDENQSEKDCCSPREGAS